MKLPFAAVAVSFVIGLGGGALIGASEAIASPYVATLEEVGSNVVASGNGQIDFSGLTLFDPDVFGSGSTGFVWPNASAIELGDGDFDIYNGAISGPSNFGSGGQVAATSVLLGGVVGLIYADGQIFVPNGYVSDTALAETNIFDNATFASLGLTPGIYKWTWGEGADQSFTIAIDATPLPAALPLFATGAGVIGLLARRRKKRAATLTA